MTPNIRLDLKTLISAIAIGLISGRSIPAAIAQPTSPSPDKIPLQSTTIPNIEGKWKMSIIGENRSTTCTLIQTGNTLTGKFRSEMGDLPVTGTVTKDRKMAFTAKFGGMSLKFSGTVEGKTMQGIVDLPMGQGRKNWTATK
jgi:hypothetical protein